MRKILLALFLAVISNNTMARWVYIAETENKVADVDAYAVYANPVTIRRSGSIVIMWGLYDYKVATEKGSRSEKRKVTYDCIQRKARMLFVSFHSGRMGSGKILADLDKNELNNHWEKVLPGSIIEASLKYACSSRPESPDSNPDGVLL